MPPATLDDPLRQEATRPDLHHLQHWAAFTHQGNLTAALVGCGGGGRGIDR
ncbi:hypothetical protein NRF20_37730 [Streptomyces sp. R-74717]|uniref:hypothetical protein n=1 Tax=Streptomyces TaxID=1883 RepID=UPI0037AF0BAC